MLAPPLDSNFWLPPGLVNAKAVACSRFSSSRSLRRLSHQHAMAKSEQRSTNSSNAAGSNNHHRSWSLRLKGAGAVGSAEASSLQSQSIINGGSIRQNSGRHHHQSNKRRKMSLERSYHKSFICGSHHSSNNNANYRLVFPRRSLPAIQEGVATVHFEDTSLNLSKSDNNSSDDNNEDGEDVSLTNNNNNNNNNGDFISVNSITNKSAQLFLNCFSSSCSSSSSSSSESALLPPSPSSQHSSRSSSFSSSGSGDSSKRKNKNNNVMAINKLTSAFAQFFTPKSSSPINGGSSPSSHRRQLASYKQKPRRFAICSFLLGGFLVFPISFAALYLAFRGKTRSQLSWSVLLSLLTVVLTLVIAITASAIGFYVFFYNNENNDAMIFPTSSSSSSLMPVSSPVNSTLNNIT